MGYQIKMKEEAYLYFYEEFTSLLIKDFKVLDL